jgi:hypothetical protein
VYLINRLPNSTHELPPLTKLLNIKLNYNDLKVLGCLCFPYLRPYTNHKLQPRFSRMYSLNMSSLKKGTNGSSYPLNVSLYHDMFCLMNFNFHLNQNLLQISPATQLQPTFLLHWALCYYSLWLAPLIPLIQSRPIYPLPLPLSTHSSLFLLPHNLIGLTILRLSYPAQLPLFQFKFPAHLNLPPNI